MRLQGRQAHEIEVNVKALGGVQVKGYRRWLIYTVECLFQNAYAAMPRGGKITVTGTKYKHWAEIRIQDTGRGVPLRLRDKLFRVPITARSRSKGLGIGSLLVTTLVEENGGMIDLEKPGPGGPILFAVALPMLLFPALTIIRHEADLAQPYPPRSQGRTVSAHPSRGSARCVLHHPRRLWTTGCVLDELYHADNRDFLEGLTCLGFYVAERSLANYGQTNLSLASSLNMVYLDKLGDRLGEGNQDPGPVNRLIRHNQVRETVEGLGYQVRLRNRLSQDRVGGRRALLGSPVVRGISLRGTLR